MSKLDELIEKYTAKTLSEEERLLLKRLVLKNRSNLRYFKEKLIHRSQGQLYHDFDAASAFEAFKPVLATERGSSFGLKKWMPYAAVLTGLLVGVVLMHRQQEVKDTVGTAAPSQATEVTDNEIVLTLPDGSQKMLNAAKNTAITGDNGIPIVHTTPSGLDYTATNNTNTQGHHNIYIPHGQKFNLTLSDGTKVWLNSGSKLTFPSRFDTASGTRTVYLDGEAFFDVASNKALPFIVNVNDLNITVLGTEFNVSAYGGQPDVATTLVEGSVRLSNGNGVNNTVVLRPNEQGAFNKFNKSVKTKVVDVNYVTAWMQSKIVFKDMPMRQILKQIERTYNVTVVNENKTIANERFTGEFDVEDVSTIFQALSTSLTFEYEITQNRIVIKK